MTGFTPTELFLISFRFKLMRNIFPREYEMPKPSSRSTTKIVPRDLSGTQDFLPFKGSFSYCRFSW